MNSEIEESPQKDEGTVMLGNRLRKNLRVLGQQGMDCYRLYDSDLPEYAFAIDIYGKQVQMAEYQAPASIDAKKVEVRREQALIAVQEVLGINREDIKLAEDSLDRFKIRDYTTASLGKDFQRQKKVHRTWLASHAWSSMRLR